MPLQTDLNVSPYFDDYNANNDYYRMLFRPGVGVQIRELNQLQTMLQAQIERFGDNIYKRGTIIDGCNFNLIPYYPYAKLQDLQLDGQPVAPALYNGLYVKNSANLIGTVVNYAQGFESKDPDLNTIYVNYINSGNTGDITSFTAGDTLTIYDSNNVLQSVVVNNGSVNYSNSDVLQIVSAIAVQNSTGGREFANGGFSIGDTLTQSTTNANVEIIAIDTTTNTEVVILKVKPKLADITNANTSSSVWTMVPGFNITSNVTSASANVVAVIGSGAQGTIVTDGRGIVTSVAITDPGEGYYVPPYVTIQSSTGSANNLVLTGRNYLAQVTVATTANAVGNGYAFGISDGIVYQKGYFLRVEPQVIIVEKYSQYPDNLAVGFDTIETIVNSNVDPSLLDNVIGTQNSLAPGANRLKLTPVLTVVPSAVAEANSDFFTILEFAEGRPYKQNRKTQYNALGDEIALRSFEQSGNFIIDRFNVATKSPSSISTEANNFNIVVDRGHGYINGKRVITQTSFEETIPKSTTTATIANTYIGANYGNYILLKELAGNFYFRSGTQVSLRDTAAQYITNHKTLVSTSNSSVIPAPGNEIGKARLRSLVYEAGTPGSNDAVYRMYIFDVEMKPGKSFADVRAIHKDGLNYDGVADIYLTYDATAGANVAQIQQQGFGSLIIPNGLTATKSINNFSYEYRTVIAAGLTANSLGYVQVNLSGNETFPYSGSLSANEKEDLIIVPLVNAFASSNAAGNVTTTSGSANIVGHGTTFLSDFVSGDYILITNGSATEVGEVERVVNNTLITLTSTATTSHSNHKAKLMFPHNVPVNLFRAGREANVSVNQQALTVKFGNTLSANANVAVSYTVKVTNASLDQKVVNRDAMVRISLANNAGSTTGPWCLGLPEIIRLKGVYKSTNVATVNVNSTDVTSHFVIDSNHTEDYLDLGYLYKRTNSSLALTGSDALLVVFDVLTRTNDGPATVSQYPIDDTVILSQANATMHTLEIPEVFGNKNTYYDLRDCIDFRPRVANTANVTTTAAAATINPAVPTADQKFGNTLDLSNTKRFPVPSSDAFFTAEYFLARKDKVIVTSNSDIKIIGGTPDILSKATFAPTPPDSLTIATLVVPPYPSMPLTLSADMYQYAETGIINQKATGRRRSSYTITVDPTKVQTKGYTMNDIGKLERRIEALEYISQLSALEDEVVNINIPSSIDPLTNRFKFGFFVDNFTSLALTDYADPEYNATILDGVLTAKLEQLNIPIENTGNNAIAYEEYAIVSQLGATDGPVTVAPVANTQATICVRQSSLPTGTDASFKYTLSANNGSGNFYFQIYTVKDSFEIYQSTSPDTLGTKIADLSDAVGLTAAERALYFDNTKTANVSATTVIGGKDFASGVGKIAFTHNAAGGQYYTVLTTKSTKTSKWVYVMCYPYDAANNVANTTPLPLPTRYVGTMKVTPPNYISGTIIVTPVQPIAPPSSPAIPEQLISTSVDPQAGNTAASNTAIRPPVLKPGLSAPTSTVVEAYVPSPLNIDSPIISTQAGRGLQSMNKEL